MVRVGVGFHNASLEAADRKSVESLFAEGALRVVRASPTLGPQALTQLDAAVEAYHATRGRCGFAVNFTGGSFK